MASNFKTTLEELLKTDARLTDENGELRGNLLRELANQLDEQLLELLLDHEATRDKFFVKVKDVHVFRHNDFKFFLDENKLDNSYTQYENKIGLSVGGKLLRENTDVVLNFPYKDCVLEGGQSTEEGMDAYFEEADGDYVEKQSKRKEIFFNEVLARDEIDRLFDPKAFTNITRYSADGTEKPTTFTRNAEGTITDNLLIKGNNLLALHSLKQEFKGKVKLIYIDPPYNTGNDSFMYNDKFNHSAWLTFMKNRLEIARELLSPDGVIFVQCDDHEQAYLKILMDEVFNSKNFVETFIWKNTDNAPALSKKTRKNIEFIHCYEKVLDSSKRYVGRNSDNDNAPLLNSGNPITDLEFSEGKVHFRISDGTYSKGMFDKVELLNDLIVENGINKNPIKFRGRFKWGQSFLNDEVGNGTYFLIKSNKFSIRYQRQIASNMAPDKLIDNLYLSKAIGIETNEDSKKHIDSLKLKFNSYPKPESLIAFLIKAVTAENDIVLDYHLGSGTTATTAHKLNRQYIGIEQMDYIQTVAVERLQNVINGEQGGISKAVNWKGGGSFVYLELAKNNEQAKALIMACNNLPELMELFGELYDKFFLHYNVRAREFREKISKEAAFVALPLTRQKEIFCRMLDLNQLYVNASEMEDSRYSLPAEDIALTKAFYQLTE